MATSVHEETILQFIAQLDARVQEKPIELLTPAKQPAYPGSDQKKRLLAERVDRGLPLHHPSDVKLPLEMAWLIAVGANGRIVWKELVEQDKAGILVLAPEITEDIRKKIDEEFGPRHFPIIGCQPPTPPTPAAKRGAA
jgi:hypothetical protein